MDLQLKNKVYLISGSTRGIGYSIAKHLISEGAQVVLNGRNQTEVQEKVTQLGESARGVVADTTTSQGVESFVNQSISYFGKIDGVVCNLGSGKPEENGFASIGEWKRVFDLNFFSAIQLMEKSISFLEKTSGNIVCISSIAGSESIGAPIPYAAAKAALNQTVLETSKYLASKNIRINAIAPGNVLFKEGTWDKIQQNDPERVQKVLQEVALKRFGKPEEIAGAVAYLLSPHSSFVTGAVWTIDGGQKKGLSC